MDKDRLQELAAHTLYKETRLVCMWATSCGKSGVLLKFLQAHPDMDCLILVPEQNNIQNWQDEFKKFNVPSEKVTIACYASLHKYTNTRWDVLVLDEVPHMDTEKRIKMLQSVRGEFVLALGAVVDDEEMAALEYVYGNFYKSIISLNKAIDMGILPVPEVRILHLKLSDVRKSWYNGRYLSEREQYNLIQHKVDNAVALYDNLKSLRNKRAMLAAGNERKRFLGKLKNDVVSRLCEKLDIDKKRYLCFCSSIAQAEQLDRHRAFTSKTPVSAKMIERFNNNELNALYVVGKCIEGQNLRDIDYGVITQLGGTDRITVQSIGRIMRSEKPIVFVVVFDNTKDSEFLNTLTSHIPDEYIKHYNVNI